MMCAWPTSRARPRAKRALILPHCNEAAIAAGREGGQRTAHADSEYALERVVAGLQQRKPMTGKEKRGVIAYHEAGHRSSPA